MKIQGIQTLTLLDYPEKTACTIFTQGCNMRCPFCHNRELLLPQTDMQVQESEFFAFLDKRRGKIDGVCISGGEPLMQDNIESMIDKIHEKGYLVKLDTNGTFPEKLRFLIEKEMLDYVAMDIKNSKEKYAETAGVENIDIKKIEKSVDFLMQGNVAYEFRTTVVKEFHDKETMDNIGQWIEGAENYYLQKYVKSENVLCPHGLHSYSDKEMEELADIGKKYVKNVAVRG